MLNWRWTRVLIEGRRLASVLMLGIAGCAQLGPVGTKEAQVERLGALFVEALPMGAVVEQVKASDSQWPFQKAPGRVTATQLACTCNELTADKVSAPQLADAREFARSYPDRVAESIRLLDSGAAVASGLVFQAGANARLAQKGRGVTDKLVRDSWVNLNASQLSSFSELVYSNQHEALRRAMRLDGLASAENSEQSHERAVRLGQSLLSVPMLAAMGRCGVQPSQVF